MPPPLPNWPRTRFHPGGGNPFLFYVIYGEVDLSAALSASRYRLGKISKELQVMKYGPDSHPEVVDSFRKGYLWKEFMREESGLASLIADQKSCLVLRGTFEDPSTLDYLRDTVGLVTHYLDHGGLAVYDPYKFEWWTPQKWKELLFEPASAVPRHHTVILTSGEPGGTEWIHTRGLGKFGRPEISIPKVAPEWKDAAIDVCDRFIEYQAFGGVIAEGKAINVNGFPPGYRCYHRGTMDDPDFNNVHVSIEARGKKSHP